jgi:hypothetical protein
MNLRNKIFCQRLLAASVVLVFSWTQGSRAQNAPPPIPAGEQPEVLTRGPVHEAFAEPVTLQYQSGFVAPIQPPDNIDEIPPVDRPSGDQYAWVPGYWSWDGDRNNYIWVSACWRAVPPNMAWVPGYWSPVANGWEWVAGFWTPAGAQEIEYLPAPPANYDVEAPGPPPIADNTWVPPCYYWSVDRYVERPGYWLSAQPGWVWVASHYLWTPRGYVFAGGHWDYPLEDRGVLFAPVYIPQTVYARRGYSYSPSVVIDIDLMSASLFVSPRYSHYYYGDYYDDAYIQVGIFPWFDRARIPDYYDPIYDYDRSRQGQFAGRWETQERHDYDDRRANIALRPARTYRDMETRVAQAPVAQRRSLEVVQPLSVVVNNSTTTITNTNITNNRLPNANTAANLAAARPATPVKFEKITPAAQAKIATQSADVKKLGSDRKGWEATAANPKAVQAPVIQKAPVITPSASRGPAAIPPAAARNPPAAAVQNTPTPASPVTPQPARNGPTAPPAVRTPAVIPPTPATSPTARNEPTASPPTRKTAAAPPREVPVAQPEKVKLPTPPVVAIARPAPAADKGPPPKPINEAKAQPEAKAPPKNDASTSPPNDAPSPGSRGGGGGRGGGAGN